MPVRMKASRCTPRPSLRSGRATRPRAAGTRSVSSTTSSCDLQHIVHPRRRIEMLRQRGDLRPFFPGPVKPDNLPRRPAAGCPGGHCSTRFTSNRGKNCGKDVSRTTVKKYVRSLHEKASPGETPHSRSSSTEYVPNIPDVVCGILVSFSDRRTTIVAARLASAPRQP